MHVLGEAYCLVVIVPGRKLLSCHLPVLLPRVRRHPLPLRPIKAAAGFVQERVGEEGVERRVAVGDGDVAGLEVARVARAQPSDGVAEGGEGRPDEALLRA